MKITLSRQTFVEKKTRLLIEQHMDPDQALAEAEIAWTHLVKLVESQPPGRIMELQNTEGLADLKTRSGD